MLEHNCIQKLLFWSCGPRNISMLRLITWVSEFSAKKYEPYDFDFVVSNLRFILSKSDVTWGYSYVHIELLSLCTSPHTWIQCYPLNSHIERQQNIDFSWREYFAYKDKRVKVESIESYLLANVWFWSLSNFMLLIYLLLFYKFRLESDIFLINQSSACCYSFEFVYKPTVYTASWTLWIKKENSIARNFQQYSSSELSPRRTLAPFVYLDEFSNTYFLRVKCDNLITSGTV